MSQNHLSSKRKEREGAKEGALIYPFAWRNKWVGFDIYDIKKYIQRYALLDNFLKHNWMISASGCHLHVIKKEMKVLMNMKFNSKNKIYVHWYNLNSVSTCKVVTKGDQWKRFHWKQLLITSVSIHSYMYFFYSFSAVKFKYKMPKNIFLFTILWNKNNQENDGKILKETGIIQTKSLYFNHYFRLANITYM